MPQGQNYLWSDKLKKAVAVSEEKSQESSRSKGGADFPALLIPFFQTYGVYPFPLFSQENGIHHRYSLAL